MDLVLGGLFIFLARVIDVSFATIRTLMLVRGMGLIAATIGFFEVIIYILALNKVVSTLDNPVNLIIYALGFATGNYVGSLLERKMAVGNITVQVITSEDTELEEKLREKNYGVTVLEGHGREGLKKVLMVLLKRKNLNRLLELIEESAPDSFVTVMDTRACKGGYIPANKRRIFRRKAK